MIYKLIWALRALLYSPFLGSLGGLSYLGAPKYISGFKKIFIGRKVRIMPGARIEVHGDGRLIIDDNCSIGNDLHIVAGSDLCIGSGALISSAVLITDMDHDYANTSLPVFEQGLLIQSTRIGKNVFIGAGAKILAGSEIGDGCIVGANAVVRGKFPDHCVIAGIPCKVVKRFDMASKVWSK